MTVDERVSGEAIPQLSQDPAAKAYIDLLMRTLTNYAYLGGERDFEAFRASAHYDLDAARWNLDRQSLPTTLLTALQLEIIRRSVAYVAERESKAICWKRGCGAGARRSSCADCSTPTPLRTGRLWPRIPSPASP